MEDNPNGESGNWGNDLRFVSKNTGNSVDSTFSMQAGSRFVKKCLGRDDASILQRVRVFLFDCDGVIWKGAEPIPGSIETLNYLKKIGKSVYYLVGSFHSIQPQTNNSTKSRSETLQKLQNMGVQSTLDEVIT